MAKIVRECAYERDWPCRLVVIIARVLESPFKKFKWCDSPVEPHPLTIGLVIVLVFDLVAVVVAAVHGVLLPGAMDVIIPLSKDYLGLILLIIFPLAAIIVFSIYRNTFLVFDKLKNNNVLSELRPNALSKFKRKLNIKFNSLVPQPAILIIVFLVIYYWLTIVPQTGFKGWANQLNIGVQVWLISWSILALFSLLYFVWKSIILCLSINRLCQNTNSLELHIQDGHPDGCGGLSPISSLWLKIHYLVVLAGLYIFGYAIFWNQWTNPAFIIAALLYVILAPTLFVGPFFSIHSRMVNNRNNKVKETATMVEKAEEAVKLKTFDPESVADDMTTLLAVVEFHRKSNEAAQKLPTWPFNARQWERFLASYCVPFAIVGIDIAWRAVSA